jgi:hypothetical protein
MKWLRALAIALALAPTPALADFLFTVGSGTTSVGFDLTHGTGAGGRCVAANTVCFGFVPMDPTGVYLFGSGNAGYVQFPSAQAVTQSGTWTVQQGTPPWSVSQSGTWNIGTVTTLTGITNALPTGGNTLGKIDILGNAGGTLDFTGQNQSGTIAAQAVGGQFNTTPTTIVSGNWSPLQLDSAGNLLVNVKAGGGAGGTSSSFGAAFPGTGTAIGVEYLSSPPTYVSGNMATLQVTSAGSLHVTADNATTLGANTSANSSPVVNSLDLVNNMTGNIAANNTTAVVVNAAATTVYSIQLGGIGSGPAYLKLYNATSATCGSGTPTKRLIIPAAATAANGAGSNVVFPLGLRFSTGLTYCITTGIGDADTTAPAASTYLVNIDWH